MLLQLFCRIIRMNIQESIDRLFQCLLSLRMCTMCWCKKPAEGLMQYYQGYLGHYS